MEIKINPGEGELDLLNDIRNLVKGSSLRKVGAKVGFSPGYLSDILHSRRFISAEVAEAFGYRREVETVVRFIKLPDQPKKGR
jgi:hypothetical protein